MFQPSAISRILNKLFTTLTYTLISVRWQAHLRDPQGPNPTLTPQNQASSKKIVQKSQKLKKQGVLTVNIIPSSHKSA